MPIDISKYNWCEIAGTVTTKLRYRPPEKDYDLCNLTLRERVGTESSNAEVFRVDEKYALKVIPTLGRDEDQELRYAEAASGLVTRGLSPYFPIVYKTGDCPDTTYSKDSRLRHRSVRYWLDRVADKRLAKKLAKSDDLYEVVYEQQRFDLPSKYILSELVWGDLDQVYRLYRAGRVQVSGETWLRILGQIIAAIGDLQDHLGIVHNDLKFANILVVVDEDSDCLRILLHDFGESYELRAEPGERKLDLERVLEQFRSRVGLEGIRGKVEKLLKFVRSYEGDNVAKQALVILND